MKIFSILTFSLLTFNFAIAKPVTLPAPDLKHDAKRYSKVIGWPADKMPVAPTGFKVSRFADNFKNPRWIYVGPNGDIFVAEAKTEEKNPIKKIGAKITGADKSQNKESPGNRIVLFRGTNPDGSYVTREPFLENLKQPFGMLILGNWFYVAQSDSLWRYPYKLGQTKIDAKGEKILDLPNGGQHWTKNIIANKDGSKIYIAIGSASNIAEKGIEKENRRAAILEVNPDGTGERIFASGLRNPVGMALHPESKILWTAVNERDDIGNDLVPDYITSVKEGGFYGWPYSYFGQNPDPRLKGQRMDLVKAAIEPDVQVGSHTASLGFAFYDKTAFPPKYRNGAFIGQHGSWNRSEFSGYQVAFVPFKGGKAAGPMETFLTGFIANADKNEVYGRPVGVAVLPDGSVLVADDAGNLIWKVSAAK